ncbi:dynein intermediate chain 3, ciliary-like [Octopus sinensis]|uniref:Dynein intermediate chain 3, ciliary-like n=1 Tax=Octopus sinensis TaxID=2607531 RepID=A0A6P7U0E6_9MOLL|nr:dynein intermediate chain 3, ciliary-like [Octopus sinensis]XP_029656693.1 dynein intermediate chain 3, ciliary-like [Octopus sinensis]
MEITYVYTKTRAEFGKQCIFTDKNPELIVDIKPKPEDKENFIEFNYCDKEVNHIPEISEHEVNTESFRTNNTGINHVEGGWPKDINCEDVDQIQRFRKKVEKDDVYITSVRNLSIV